MENFKKVARLVWQFNREFVLIVLFYGICISGLNLAIPLAIQGLVNSIAFIGSLQPIIVLGLILFTCLIVSGLFRVLQAGIIDLFHRRLVATLAPQISNRLRAVPDEYREEHDLAELTNRYFDIFVAQKSFGVLFTEGFAVSLQLIVGMLVVAFYHPFFLMFAVITIGAFAAIAKIFGRFSTESAILESKAKYALGKHLQRQASLPVNADSATVQSVQHDVTVAIATYDSKRAAHFRHLLWQIVALVSMQAIGGAIFLGLGGWLVNKSQLSLGQLVAAELIITTSLANIAKSGKIFEKWYDLVAAFDKVGQLLALPAKEGSQLSRVDTDFDIPLFELEEEEGLTQSKIAIPSLQYVVFRVGVILFALTTLAMFVVPWQQTSEGFGTVVALDPADRIQTINSIVKGRISKWYVQDGQQVAQGDPIVEILDIDPLYVQRLQQENEAFERKVELSRIAASVAENNWRRQQELVSQGLSSKRDAEKAQIEYKKLASELASNEASLAKSKSRLSREQVRTITAPADGQILQILNDGVGGVLIKEGSQVAVFEPSTQRLSAEVFMDGNDLSLISEGRKVRLQFEGWPALQAQGWPSLAVGTFDGEVYAIDSSVTKRGKYRVLVTPDPDSDLAWPNTKYLRQGTAVHAWVQLDTVSLGYEIWRNINGFPLSVVDASQPTIGPAEKP